MSFWPCSCREHPRLNQILLFPWTEPVISLSCYMESCLFCHMQCQLCEENFTRSRGHGLVTFQRSRSDLRAFPSENGQLFRDLEKGHPTVRSLESPCASGEPVVNTEEMPVSVFTLKWDNNMAVLGEYVHCSQLLAHGWNYRPEQILVEQMVWVEKLAFVPIVLPVAKSRDLGTVAYTS